MHSATDSTPSILIIEDCEEDFDTVQEALRRSGRGAPLIRATSGDAGLEWLDRLAVAGHLPKLVLLDLNTPGNDGRDLLRTLKSAPAFKDIKVVVFTTSSNPRDLEFCQAAGADAYHMKPFLFTEHLGLVEQIFARWLDSEPAP